VFTKLLEKTENKQLSVNDINILYCLTTVLYACTVSLKASQVAVMSFGSESSNSNGSSR
jgi:hypothetical protein